MRCPIKDQFNSGTIKLVARFVIERVPGKGYCIIFNEGERCLKIMPYVLKILDNFGQPNPIEDSDIFEFAGPFGPQGEYVGILFKRLKNGEQKIEQKWFAIVEEKNKRFLNVHFVSFTLNIVFVFIVGFLVFDQKNKSVLYQKLETVLKGDIDDLSTKLGNSNKDILSYKENEKIFNSINSSNKNELINKSSKIVNLETKINKWTTFSDNEKKEKKIQQLNNQIIEDGYRIEKLHQFKNTVIDVIKTLDSKLKTLDSELNMKK